MKQEKPTEITKEELTKLSQSAAELCREILAKSEIEEAELFVLGLSTSEVRGAKIGQDGSLEIGRAIVRAIHEVLSEAKIELAVQGCEHINRALSLERASAKRLGLEIVSVKPALHAGGAGSVAAWEIFEDPCCVEFISAAAGLDIGDTAIGMHVKHVQVPLRLSQKELGQAHITALRSRPKLIGGPRAEY
ncbi:MAG: TIGR01440 family protein [Eubacteriales bacterium]|nr:TIGR01440 family protein [Eubacteriales bacterium]